MLSTISKYAATVAADPKIILYPNPSSPVVRREDQGRFTRPVVLRDRDIIIRGFQPADAAGMHEAAHESMDELCTWMTWCHPAYTVADARAFIAECPIAWSNGDHYSFAIIDSRDYTFLGSIGLNSLNAAHKTANIGYWVRQSAGGRGVATTATRLIARFALRQLELNRLELLIPEVNVASQRVAQKSGAKFEGLLRNRLMIGERCHDAVLYSLLRLSPALPCASLINAATTRCCIRCCWLICRKCEVVLRWPMTRWKSRSQLCFPNRPCRSRKSN